MKNPVHLKYLIVNETDLLWGLTVNSVGYQSIPPGSQYPPSNHPTRYLFSTDKGRILDEYQLLYITKGSGTFFSKTGGKVKSQTIKEGDMFLLFPGEWHNYMPDSGAGWDEYWIGFKGANIDKRIENGFFSKQSPILNVGINTEIVQLYQEAVKVASEQRSGFQQMLAGIVNHLLGLAYSLDKNFTLGSSETADRINRAKIIISENLKTIKPQEIALRLNMSYSSFRKIFREYTGFAPAQYIQEMKIQSAKELLTNSTVPVKEIAYMLGFENQEYFFTAFRNKTKSTPAEYRRFTRGGQK